MTGKPFKQGFLYTIGTIAIRGHLKIWNNLTSIDADKIPREGGLIIASNHISHLDPPAVGVSVPRDVRFVGKEELFRQPFLGWYLPRVGVIPIKRGSGGREMLDKAAEALRNGDCIAMFPEGTRSKTGHPQRPRTGFIVLAAMANVPVLPARISGSYDCMPPGSLWPMPGKIQVAFGDPIKWAPGELDLNNRDQLVTEARRLMDIIQSLPGWTPKKAEKSEPEQSGQGNQIKI